MDGLECWPTKELPSSNRLGNTVKTQKEIIQGTALVLGGKLLVIAGAFLGSETIQRALLSEPNRSLSWGPILFRCLLIAHGLILTFVAARMVMGIKGQLPAEPRFKIRTKTGWHWWVALVGLSMIALGLRLWRLNTDLWFDELLTLLNFVRMPLGDIITRLPDQNNHILFSILSHASVRIFGESAWSVRLPSVVFGVASLWALFLLGRRVLDSRGAFLACGLMAVSYHHIWFSQNARGYMALLFFSILATWIWIEAQQRQTWKWWIAYSVVVALGMWTHLTMVFVVLAHALVYTATFFQSITGKQVKTPFSWRPLAAFILGATLTLQLYALALPEFLSVGLHEVSLESEWTNPWWVIIETLRNLRIGFSGMLVVLGAGVMVGLGWLNLMRREWQAAVLLVLPPVLAGGTMIALGHNLWPRFFFFSMAFALLIAVYGALTLPRFFAQQIIRWPVGERLSAGAGLVLAFLMILASAVTVPHNYAFPKQDYSGARDFVERQRGPNDAVVAVGLAGVAYRSYFAPSWSVAQTDAELEVVKRGKSNVWLIYTLPVEVKAYRKEVWQRIQSDFTVVKVFPGTLGGGEIIVCRQSRENNGRLAQSF
jgi:mannosyltransferase